MYLFLCKRDICTVCLQKDIIDYSSLFTWKLSVFKVLIKCPSYAMLAMTGTILLIGSVRWIWGHAHIPRLEVIVFTYNSAFCIVEVGVWLLMRCRSNFSSISFCRSLQNEQFYVWTYCLKWCFFLIGNLLENILKGSKQNSMFKENIQDIALTTHYQRY